MIKRAIYLLSPVDKANTIYLPMIDFSIVNTELDLSQCDTLMFTSKQAVKSANILNCQWKEYPSLAIGTATARQIENLGGKVEYCSTSFYGASLSQEIINRFKNRNILYLRPKEISFDSKRYLAQRGIILQEKVIYQTHCVTYPKEAKPQHNAIIIFTSPSTIHCFLKNFSWDMSYIAIVIGESTKAHLPKNIQYEVADEPTIDACIKKAYTILSV